MGVLFLFVYHLLKLFGQMTQCSSDILATAERFPKSLHKARSMILEDASLFYEYTACPRCRAVYNQEACTENSPDGSLISKKCLHIKFPNHQHQSQRQPCSVNLLQKKKIGMEYKLKPYKIYSYNSLKKAVQRLISRPGFLQKCEQWRN